MSDVEHCFKFIAHTYFPSLVWNCIVKTSVQDEDLIIMWNSVLYILVPQTHSLSAKILILHYTAVFKINLRDYCIKNTFWNIYYGYNASSCLLMLQDFQLCTQVFHNVML